MYGIPNINQIPNMCQIPNEDQISNMYHNPNIGLTKI